MPNSKSKFSMKTVGERLLTDKAIQWLEIAVVILPVLLVIFALQFLDTSNPFLLFGAIWVANIAMLLLIWLGVKLRGDTLDSIGLSFRYAGVSTIVWSFLKSIPIFLLSAVAFIFVPIVMAAIVSAPSEADFSSYNYMQGNLPMLLISLVGVYIVSSMGEEIVYRGFLITRLQALFGGEGRKPVFLALIFSSLIFGLAHLGWGLIGIVQTSFVGLAMGAAFLLTKRRLWPLIIAHGYLDTLLFVQLYLAT